jgi:hypothetical protein
MDAPAGRERRKDAVHDEREAVAADRAADASANRNVVPFGPFMSPACPPTAAATAASGVLTPQPCLPNIPAPWTPGSPTVTIANHPALVQTDTCRCVWGGTVSITDPGQAIVTDA